MKLQVLTVLCICLVQICFDSVNSEMTFDIKNEARKFIRDRNDDGSKRFFDDVFAVSKKFRDSPRVIEGILGHIYRLTRIREDEKVSKIDVDSIKKFKTRSLFNRSAEDEVLYIDYMRTYQAILSTRVSSEIANGMTNLGYAIGDKNATTEHMENAVKFLYSNKTVAIEDPFRNFQVPSASECPKNVKRYSAVQEKLKAMTGIKPSVLEDVAIIIGKFSCSRDDVPEFLEHFIKLIIRLQALAAFVEKPISACLLKEHSELFDSFFYLSKRSSPFGVLTDRSEIESQLKLADLILATRLMEERFRGLINFERAAVLTADTPINDIQKALEYVFLDVAPSAAECSTKEHDDELFDAFYENFQSQYNKNQEE